MKTKHAKVVMVLVLVSAVFISGYVRPDTGVSEQALLKQFSSRAEIEAFLERGTQAYFGGTGMMGGTFAARTTMGQEATVDEAMTTGVPSDGADAGADDYSTTNIQVEGVDEADIVKNDGRYIYAIAGNRIVIVDAFPPENAQIVAEINISGTPSEMFINGNSLVVMGTGYFSKTEQSAGQGTESKAVAEIAIAPTYSYGAFVHVYDITDRANPVIDRNVSMSGNYYDSRMIGDYAYIITNENIYYSRPNPVPLPMIIDDGISNVVPAREIYYFDVPDYSYIYTSIVAVNTQNADEDVNSKTFLMSYSNSMYASADNIYMVYTKRFSMDDFYERIVEDVLLPILPVQERAEAKRIWDSDLGEQEKLQQIGEVYEEYLESLGPEAAASWMQGMEQRMQAVMIQISKEIEKTIIHKISVDGRNIEYKTAGEVPGHVFNQFSMDEYNGYFRIATTTGSWQVETSNHMYVLDSELDIVGKVEDLAPGERIHSTRFIGDKGYMVTFRQIDPLFVIDFSNPTNPQMLGYLKIPGVSDYLHPYDSTHLIGVGRDATEEGRMKGMKLSLFDVSDFENPREMHSYYIGERGTTSEAIYEHKAFLFDREKGLLVLPITLAEGGKWQAWEGAYVFSLDLDSGFTLKGEITHQNETAMQEDDDKRWKYYDYAARIRRSLYMDDVLYTVSARMIKANDLNDIYNELAKVELPVETYDYYPYPIGIRGGGMIEPAVSAEGFVVTEAVQIDE